MKALIFALILTAASISHAKMILVTGAKADALVSSLVALGLDPFGTHEYFQAGVTACTTVTAAQDEYFPGSQIGEYVGESCLVFGDADGSDPDGALRTEALMPADDRELKRNPELKAKLAKLKSVRASLEAIVIPVVKKEMINGREVVIYEMSGISGIACEGRNAQGQRQCYVKISTRCPAR